MGTLELSNLIQLEINENLRNISIPKKGVVFGVDGDIEVNRVAFVFPRYYSNFDMTEFSARVNYVNANGEANYYEADDVSSDDGDTATFSWLMTSDVTSYIGEVRFSVLLYKQLDERYVKKFGTRPATGRVLEGLDVESYVTPEQQLTLIEKMEKKFDAYVEAKMLSVNHDIEDAKNGALDAIEEAKNDVDSFIASSKSEIDSLLSSSLDDIKNLADTSKLNISTLTDEKLASLDKETVRQLKNIELAGVEETEKIRTAFSSAVSDIQAEGQKQADAVDSHGDSKIKEIDDSTATSLANINSISEKQVEAIQLEGTKQASSVSSEGNKQVSTVASAGATEVTKVKKASSTALSDIGSAKESSISEITAKGTEQVKTIKDTSAGEISKVQAAGMSQVKSVSDEGKIQIDGVKSEGEKQVQSVSAKGTQSLQDIDTAKTAAVKSVNDQTKPIIDKVEQLKQNVNDKSDSVDEAYEQMKKLHCIEISEKAPTNERAGLWVNPESNEEINIPEIKDEEVSDIDTWSSQKINHEIDSLKEDLSNKITKFYASNQGETHITDSDNGKIQDMMIYGKSSQNGTPTPENPVEIKSVVNPTVKVCGKNLWNPILGGYISGNDGSIAKGLKTQIAVTDFIKTSGKDITVIARNFSSVIECSYAYRIGLYNAEKKWIKNIFPSGGNKYSINTFNITGTEYIRVSAPSGIYDTIQIEKGSEATPYEPYTEQSVQLPYTLNAIPVTSGGNVTIDRQQYIADYVDIESGKYVQKIQTDKVQSNRTWQIQKQPKGYSLGYISLYENGISTQELGMKNAWKSNMGDSSQSWSNGFSFGRSNVFWIVPYKNDGNITSDDINAWLVEHPMDIMYPLAEPIETDLTPEEIEAFKGLVTNYPVTNVSITSDQLDGYTVFNYPISMAEGWNYIKQQLNDNRDYIYDMDAKAQDIDTQAAEAYVNSEYAVALTELEV